MQHICEVELDTWDEFKRDIVTDQFPNGDFLRGRFLFRGQGNSNWKLETTFDRWYKGPSDRKIATANLLIDFFENECEQHELPHSFDGNRNSWLALAQHHGLPTRLLDWSESPYVAAMFAFGGHLRARHSDSDKVAICVIDSRSHIWSEENGCAIVTVPSYGNVRIASQFGKFTQLKSPVNNIEQHVSQFIDNSTDTGEANLWIIRKYYIPASESKKAIGDLDAMGLNYSRIYPGLVGNAMAAEVRVGLSLM